MRHERSVGPSPRAIDEAIAARVSSAGWFQRVAEQIARGFYPDRPVTPFGRNPADKTVAGWPDAYILWDEGGVIAIEATTEAKARQRHWAEDLQKLRRSLPRDQRQGLIWVAWEHEPPPDDVARWQRVGRQRRPEQVGEPPARPRAPQPSKTLREFTVAQPPPAAKKPQGSKGMIIIPLPILLNHSSPPKKTSPPPPPRDRGGRRGRSSPPAFLPFAIFPTQHRKNDRRRAVKSGPAA